MENNTSNNAEKVFSAAHFDQGMLKKYATLDKDWTKIGQILRIEYHMATE